MAMIAMGANRDIAASSTGVSPETIRRVWCGRPSRATVPLCVLPHARRNLREPKSRTPSRPAD